MASGAPSGSGASAAAASESPALELFVPGRVCLLGEHTDWAGGFRRFNPALCAGYTVVTGTNQGIHARVRKCKGFLRLSSTDNAGARQHAEIAMDLESLLRTAREGGHFSYIAGVAYKMLLDNVIDGIEIDNYMTTLPLKKGLSSSAAICVLTARAFSKLYDLRLTTRGEMEYAYQGELMTPSKCGRLDQACAFGSTPVKMTYDGEFTGVDRLSLAFELHFLVVDLCATKSTTTILSALQGAYPVASTAEQRELQEFLGPRSKARVEQLEALLEGKVAGLDAAGVVEAIGALMSEAQRDFDRCGGALCPSQLTAPALHRCLEHPSLRAHCAGGKWVGAGGDGTAVLICRSPEAQRAAATVVRSDLHMDPILLTLSPGSRVRTAVIPAGGFPAALFPACHACKAELFPVLDPEDGIVKPLILGTVEQLLRAGLERVILVVQPEDLAQFKRLLQEDVSASNARRLPAQLDSYAKRVIDMGRHVDFVVQEQQKGFGHAVWCARDLVGQHPFLLVLGHHVYVAGDRRAGCAAQVLEAHRRLGTNVVGLKRTPLAEVHKFGTVAGSFRGSSALLQPVLTVTALVEKPDRAFAEANLRTPGLPEGEYLTLFGMYAVDHQLFQLLDEDVRHDLRGANGEIQLTPALDRLRLAQGLAGVVVDGERLSISTPEAYIRANQRLLDLSLDLSRSSSSKPSAPVHKRRTSST